MNQELNTVFTAIGGVPKVQEILLKFYTRLSKDVMVGFFFDGFDLALIAKKQAAFLLRSAGFSQVYEDRTPDQAHKQLPHILPGHFDRRIRLLEEVLKEEGLSESQIQTWVEFEEAFRPMIEKSDRDCSGS